MSAAVLRTSRRAHRAALRSLNMNAKCSSRYCSSGQGGSRGTSVLDQEIARFAQQAPLWWDISGPASMLQRMTPIRVAFIRAAIQTNQQTKQQSRLADASKVARNGGPSVRHDLLPLQGITIADIGCGVGLLSEPLARLGARLLGVDASSASVSTAEAHGRGDGALQVRMEATAGDAIAALEASRARSITYCHSTAEEVVGALSSDRTPTEHSTAMKRPMSAGFDAVVASEVVEHVKDARSFLENCAALVRPGGVFVLTSLNRTATAYALAICVAERMLSLLPVGTHDWTQFATPEEVTAIVQNASGMDVREVVGMRPTIGKSGLTFKLTPDTSVNYAMWAAKPPSPSQQTNSEHSETL